MVHAWDPVAHAATPVPPPVDIPARSRTRRRRTRPSSRSCGASTIATARTRAGAVATYIPELARADPASFGIVIATVDGAVYEIGDTRTPFTIQSMAKPLTYAAILDRLGAGRRPPAHRRGADGRCVQRDLARRRHGHAAQPDGQRRGDHGGGDDARRGRCDHPDAARLDALVASLGRFAGRELTLDEAVYRSERDTGHRNRAIAHLLRGTGAIADDDPDAVVDAYFKVCAVSVTARDLALIAATLANGGRHPITGEQAARDATVRDVLSVMATCGMYDGAGEWMYDVGLPAKSGVSGGIFAVLPGQLGIGVWSPPLDARGNSVRGVAVCRDLARELDLHLVRGLRPPSPVRTRANVAAPAVEAQPRRARARADLGRRRAVARGRAAGQPRLRRRRDARPRGAPGRRGGRRGRRGPAAGPADRSRRSRRSSRTSSGRWERAGRPSRGAASAMHGDVLALVDEALAERRLGPPRRFAELDLALEWAEDVVLSRFKGPAIGSRPERWHVPLAEHPAFVGLDRDTVACLERVMERRQFRSGEALVRHGEPADELFVITGGRLSVWVPVGAQDTRRLATLEAGTARRRARVPRPRAADRGRLLRHGGRGVRPDRGRVRRPRDLRPGDDDRVPRDAPADRVRDRPPHDRRGRPPRELTASSASVTSFAACGPRSARFRHPVKARLHVRAMGRCERRSRLPQPWAASESPGAVDGGRRLRSAARGR